MRVAKGFVVATLVSIIMGGISLPTGSAATVHVVHRGESIQAAIDAASSGDTVIVQSGVFREYISIQFKSITLVGSRGTVLRPPSTGLGLCDGVSICTDADGVTLRNLRIEGYPGEGVFAQETEGLTIERVRVQNNADAGIVVLLSIGAKLVDNVVRRNGSDGIFMQQIFGTGNEISGNLVKGNGGRGATVKQVANIIGGFAVQGNKLLANCGGILVEEASASVDVSRNVVRRPNPQCQSPSTGIELVNSKFGEVSNNLIRGYQANGIRLDTNSEGNVVASNVARHNTPYDLKNDGTNNTFTDNRCETSAPPELCS